MPLGLSDKVRDREGVSSSVSDVVSDPLKVCDSVTELVADHVSEPWDLETVGLVEAVRAVGVSSSHRIPSTTVLLLVGL